VPLSVIGTAKELHDVEMSSAIEKAPMVNAVSRRSFGHRWEIFVVEASTPKFLCERTRARGSNRRNHRDTDLVDPTLIRFSSRMLILLMAWAE
jgi:hypothetical protein